MREVRIGFMPLIDCAAIAVAHELGLADRRGIRLVPSREPSWAAIRDKVAFGRLDAAHMLAPMPVAMTLGLGGPKVGMRAPLTLGLGGNAITVSEKLHADMLTADPEAMAGARALSARALGRVAADRRTAGRPPLRFASVFPFSSHHYELRSWLANGGVDPDRDVALLIIPPPRMVENLISGLVDGFCVGEPWNQLAVTRGLGRIVATKSNIASVAPEKVLGMRRAWCDDNAELAHDLISVLVEAAAWAEDHRDALADLLAAEQWVGVPAALLLPCLRGRPFLADREPPAEIPGYHSFRSGPANVPGKAHVAWLAEQMTRSGHVGSTEAGIIETIFMPIEAPAIAEPS
ncbi:MAG: CmpA/NrtA family ABC transporter substrate-binding protein [Alphaproteobacteria bacterium]